MNTLNTNLICAIPLTWLRSNVRLPSTCIQAFVNQCDSGEALINSSPTLGYPPPISLNTHTKTQMQESHNSAARACQKTSCTHLCAFSLPDHMHTPTHQDTSFNSLFCPNCVNLHCVTHAQRGVCFCGALPFAPLSGGEGRDRWDSVSVHKPAELREHKCLLYAKVWWYLLSHEVTFTAVGPKPDGLTCAKRRFLFHPPSFFSFLRASCFGGSPRPLTARMGRSPATRSDTGKDPEGVKRLRPPEAPSFTSSSTVMGTQVSQFRPSTLHPVCVEMDWTPGFNMHFKSISSQLLWSNVTFATPITMSNLCHWLITQLVYSSIIFRSIDDLQLFLYNYII